MGGRVYFGSQSNTLHYVRKSRLGCMLVLETDHKSRNENFWIHVIIFFNFLYLCDSDNQSTSKVHQSRVSLIPPMISLSIQCENWNEFDISKVLFYNFPILQLWVKWSFLWKDQCTQAFSAFLFPIWSFKYHCFILKLLVSRWMERGIENVVELFRWMAVAFCYMGLIIVLISPFRNAVSAI